MLLRTAGMLLASVVVLAGCAGPVQAPLPLANDYFTAQKPGRVGVLVTDLPKADTFFPGADCLLCMAAASMANSSLTDHTRTLGTDDLKPLKEDLVKLLRDRGVDAVVIAEPLKLDSLPDRASGSTPNQSRKDFGALRDKHKIDRLLVVNFTQIGVVRPYSAYIANGAPRATVRGAAFLVNLGSHTLEWYEPIEVSRGAEGKWDEPPKFPGISNAYFQTLELGMDTVKKPFGKK